MEFNSEHGGNTLEAAQALGVAAVLLTDFSANINPLGMPDSLKRAMMEQLSLAERYPDVEYRALHAALARHHRVLPEWVIAGNGETELIFSLVHYLAPRKALLLTPGFAEYRRALARVGCEVKDFALEEAKGWQPDEALLEALTPELDCLFLCTPNNPTGLMPDKALLRKVADRCKALGIALIIDEAFVDFMPDEEGLIPWLVEYPRLYILRSLTKFFAIPGLRLGYLVSADVATVKTIRREREPWTINAFAALAGEVILEDKAYIEATHLWLRVEQPRLFSLLDALPGITVWPPAANYIFLRCDVAGLDLQQALLTAHVLIRHCKNYPGLDERFYRVAVRSARENDLLIAALSAVLSGTGRAAG
jgi:threonine-phosphate decarboxylase